MDTKVMVTTVTKATKTIVLQPEQVEKILIEHFNLDVSVVNLDMQFGQGGLRETTLSWSIQSTEKSEEYK